MATAPEQASTLDALDEVALAEPRRLVDSTLEAAREMLDMEIAYFSEFVDENQVVRSVAGPYQSFNFEAGVSVPLVDSYCRRMVSGYMRNVVHDAKTDENVRDLPATTESDMGSYVGVPLRLPDGRVYGSLCCASHQPRHELDDRDVAFLRVLARVLGDHLGLEGSPPPERPSMQSAGRDGLVATLSLWFTGAAHAAASARNALAALEDHLGEGRRQDLKLVVTELVSNCVRHSGIGPASSVGLEIRVGSDRLWAEVTDAGSGFEPVVRGPTPDDLDRTGGWGLYLVEQLTERWGVEQDGLTRVWFEMALAPSGDT